MLVLLFKKSFELNNIYSITYIKLNVPPVKSKNTFIIEKPLVSYLSIFKNI